MNIYQNFERNRNYHFSDQITFSIKLFHLLMSLRKFFFNFAHNVQTKNVGNENEWKIKCTTHLFYLLVLSYYQKAKLFLKTMLETLIFKEKVTSSRHIRQKEYHNIAFENKVLVYLMGNF